MLSCCTSRVWFVVCSTDCEHAFVAGLLDYAAISSSSLPFTVTFALLGQVGVAGGVCIQAPAPRPCVC